MSDDLVKMLIDQNTRIENKLDCLIEENSGIQVTQERHGILIQQNANEIKCIKDAPEKRRNKAEFWISVILGGSIGLGGFLLTYIFGKK